MKKILVFTGCFLLIATIISSCAAGKSKGCPTTNKNYFKP